jgi:hypothetical protein
MRIPMLQIPVVMMALWLAGCTIGPVAQDDLLQPTGTCPGDHKYPDLVALKPNMSWLRMCLNTDQPIYAYQLENNETPDDFTAVFETNCSIFVKPDISGPSVPCGTHELLKTNDKISVRRKGSNVYLTVQIKTDDGTDRYRAKDALLVREYLGQKMIGLSARVELEDAAQIPNAEGQVEYFIYLRHWENQPAGKYLWIQAFDLNQQGCDVHFPQRTLFEPPHHKECKAFPQIGPRQTNSGGGGEPPPR